MIYLLLVPGIAEITRMVLSAFFDEGEDVIGSEAELGEVADPLGLQGLLVRVGRSLEPAAGDLAGHDESVPSSSWKIIKTIKH